MASHKSSPSSLRHKLIRAIGVTFAILVFVTAGIALFLNFKQDWIVDKILARVNALQSGHVTLASARISVLSRLPNASIEISNLAFYEKDPNISQGEIPILQADQFYLTFDVMALVLDSKIEISSAGIENGKLRLLQDSVGVWNVKRVIPTTPSSEKGGVKLRLESFAVDRLEVMVKKSTDTHPSDLIVKEMEIDMSDGGKVVTCQLNSGLDIRGLQLKNYYLSDSGALQLNAGITYNLDSQYLDIKSGGISYKEFTADLQGYFNGRNQEIDIEFNSTSSDFVLLSLLIKENVLKFNPDLLKGGRISARGRLFGSLHQLNLEASLKASKIDLKLPAPLGSFKDVQFEASFRSGAARDFSDASLEIRNLKGSIPGGAVDANVSLRNWVHPFGAYHVNINGDLEGYDRIFNFTSISDLAGKISLKADYEGELGLVNLKKMEDPGKIRLNLNDVSFRLNKSGKIISETSGSIQMDAGELSLIGVRLKFDSSQVMIDGAFTHPVQLILNRDADVHGTFQIQAQQFFSDHFVPNNPRGARINERLTNLKATVAVETTVKNLRAGLGFPALSFTIPSLEVEMEDLPDIRRLSTLGEVLYGSRGAELRLHQFKCELAQGQFTLESTLRFVSRDSLELEAELSMNQFPWKNIDNLIGEIKGEPNDHSSLPVERIDDARMSLSCLFLLRPFALASVNMDNAHANVALLNSKTFQTGPFSLQLRHVNFFKSPALSGIGLKSIEGQIQMEAVQLPGVGESILNMDLEGVSDKFTIDFVTNIFTLGKDKGRLTVNANSQPWDYQMDYAVNDQPVEPLIRRLHQKQYLKGQVDVNLHLRTEGLDRNALDSVSGNITISADSLLLLGIEIDPLLRDYKKSQNFNLVDVGAFVVAGPAGPVITKSTDFVKLMGSRMKPTDETLLKQVLFDVKLIEGNLITQDVAFATEQNRLAMMGRIDYLHDSIPGFTVAVVDKNGCSLLNQRFYGKFDKIKRDKINVAGTLVGSVTNLVNAIADVGCKPVYTGKVRHPR